MGGERHRFYISVSDGSRSRSILCLSGTLGYVRRAFGLNCRRVLGRTPSQDMARSSGAIQCPTNVEIRRKVKPEARMLLRPRRGVRPIDGSVPR